MSRVSKLLLSFAVLTVAGCRAPQPKLEPEETVLATLPQSYDGVAVSDDCRHLAFYQRKVTPPTPPAKNWDYKWRVVVDGKPGQFFGGTPPDYIAGDMPRTLPPCLSPTGGHFAYQAYRTKRAFVVRDGVEGKGYGIVSDVTFSPNGRHLRYVAMQSKESIAVVDGKELARGAEVAIADSCTHAVGVVKEPGGGFWVTGDEASGSERRLFDKVLELKFSPDGNRFAFAARAGDNVVVVLDGRTYGPYRRIPGLDFEPGTLALAPYTPPPGVVFSPNGSLCLWLAEHDGRQCLVVNGREVWSSDPSADPHHDWGLASLAFSSDGRHYAFHSLKNGRWVIVRDGKEARLPKGLNYPRDPVLSSDGHSLAYVAGDGGDEYGYHIVVGDKVGPKTNVASKVWMSPDGRHVTYATQGKNGDGAIVVDGWHSRPLHGYDQATQITAFSPASNHWAVVIPQGKQCDLVVDGKVLRTYDDIFERKVVFDGPSLVRCIAERKGKAIRIALRISGSAGLQTRR